LELAEVETHLSYLGRVPGRPLECRSAIARAFVVKAVYNLPTTAILLDQLESNTKLRRLCGWEKKNDVPSSSTFSRAFAEFAQSQLEERVHTAVVERHLGDQLIGHISRNSTSIVAREKPVKPQPEENQPKKRGRPKKGEE
jgi:transposase